MAFELLVIVVSYLLGSVSFSVLLARLLKGIDIRQYGSGNAGATNTLRVLGKGPAILVLILDVLKGIAAVWLGTWAGGWGSWVAVAAELQPLSVTTGRCISISAGARGLLRRSASWRHCSSGLRWQRALLPLCLLS
ncbi:glycerol-3-phosphate acyltransferase [Paenibacillus sp. DMB5]|uniref:glycerol-3-phosphate acyltransferase n=1 Tax=Paenibacillus sp. DMB5 TaxID=1780103 RepID=UPI001F51F256|nr:glycerol-3-phosphate acyltransferase [Paenibacillus sp. DMB5]